MREDKKYFYGVILTFISLGCLSRSLQGYGSVTLSIIALVVGFTMVLTGYIK